MQNGTPYQIQNDKDPSIIKTEHRNYLVKYYPKKESLPIMIEEYVPHDQRQNDNFLNGYWNKEMEN